MPKGYHKDGTAHKPVNNRPPSQKLSRGYKFDPDVISALDKQDNATAYLQSLVRADIKRKLRATLKEAIK